MFTCSNWSFAVISGSGISIVQFLNVRILFLPRIINGIWSPRVLWCPEIGSLIVYPSPSKMHWFEKHRGPSAKILLPLFKFKSSLNFISPLSLWFLSNCKSALRRFSKGDIRIISFVTSSTISLSEKEKNRASSLKNNGSTFTQQRECKFSSKFVSFWTLSMSRCKKVRSSSWFTLDSSRLIPFCIISKWPFPVPIRLSRTFKSHEVIFKP